MPNTIADGIKKYLLLYWLPSDAVAEAFPVILGAYITVLSLLRNLAVNDSQNDLNNSTLSEQPGFAEQYQYLIDNYTEFAENYTVIVSNAVLWVCREGSPDGHFYRTFYTLAIVFIIVFHLFTGFSRFFTQRFYFVYKKETSGDDVTTSRKPKDLDVIVKTILSSVFFNLAILMLLLSFDISPWSCLHRPYEIYVDYFPTTNRFSIQIDHAPDAIRFQQGASIVSAILAAFWVTIHVAFYCYDYGGICERVEDEYDGEQQNMQLQSMDKHEHNDND